MSVTIRYDSSDISNVLYLRIKGSEDNITYDSTNAVDLYSSGTYNLDNLLSINPNYKYFSFAYYYLVSSGVYGVRTTYINNALYQQTNPITLTDGTTYVASYTLASTGYASYGSLVQGSYYTVTTSVSPSLAGTTTGDGSYLDGSNFTVTATPTSGSRYVFQNWTNTQSGRVVSTSSTYTGTNNREQQVYLTANFGYDPYDPSTDPEDLPSDNIIDTKATNWMKHGDTNMYCIFLPTDAQLQNLSTWLYGSDFLSSIVGQGLLSIDLMDIFISFCVLPFSITTSNSKYIKVGWWGVTTSSGAVTMNYTLQNYYQVDCGTVTVNGIYGGALDYQTNVDIYLPFIGYQSLETYDVVGHTINPIYQIDLLTGDCVCKIKIDNSIKYQFTGNCSYNIPMSQISKTAIVDKTISTAVGAITAIASPVHITTGGETKQSSSINYSKIDRQETSRKFSETVTPRISKQQFNPQRTLAEAIGTFTNMGNGSARGGSLSGNTGYLGVGKPYLNITRPHVDIPTDFGVYNGYPCNKVLTLGNLSGFTMVDEIHLSGFSCTDGELGEIEQLLKEGVVL